MPTTRWTSSTTPSRTAPRNLAGMAVRFVAVGELLLDVVAEGSGHDARIRVRPGGSAFNAAVAAAAAGANATAIGTVGDDAAGRTIVAELRANGVQPIVAVIEGRTGTFLLDDGVIRVDPGDAHKLGYVGPIVGDAVLVSGYLPAAGEVLEAAEAPWVALDAARLTELPNGGNVLIANENAARRLTGKDADEAARGLGERYRLACVTRGAHGAVAVLDGRLEAAAPGASVSADVPGAGDAFAAALLVSLADGANLAVALAAGCESGARVAALGSTV